MTAAAHLAPLAAAVVLVVYARREHARARARQSLATTDLPGAIEMYGAADDLLQEAHTELLDSRAPVGEWQAAETAAVNPDGENA